MGCIAPSFVVNPAAASAFGLLAEAIIGGRYLNHVGRSTFFPASTKDFQDISVGFGNTILFISFLKTNNKLSASQLLSLSASGLVNIPDLMTHDPPRRTEFYEIKPNSIDGVVAGKAKIASLSALFSFLGLSYKAGTIWSPDERIKLWSGYITGAWIEAYLHYFASPTTKGLIVYELCIEGEVQKALEHIALAVLIATIIIFILKIPPIPVPA
jgi:hypothetical protein